MNLKEKIIEKPIEIISVIIIILSWMLIPLIAQKYYNISAIKVSFAITVVYFVVWKIYNNRELLSNNH